MMAYFLDRNYTSTVWPTLSKLIRVSVLVCCLLMVSAIPIFAQDFDGDGVPDAKDDFPSDNTRVVDISAIPALDAVSGNMAMWLDMSDLERMVTESGTLINTIYDKSANGRSATQSSTSLMATLNVNQYNGLAAAKFDGADSYNIDLSFLAGSAYTMIVIESRDNGNSSSYLLGTTPSVDNEGLHFGYQSNGIFTLDQWNNGLDIVVNDYPETGKPNLSTGILDISSGHSVYRNGTLAGSNSNTVTFNAAENGTLGTRSSNNYTGDILEVLIFDKALSASELTDVNDYLSQKWGLESTVDSDNDGIPDGKEEFPTDNTRVLANSNIPDSLLAVSGNITLWLTDEVTVNAVATKTVGLDSNGVSINAWYDYSGNGFSITQTSLSIRPTLSPSGLGGRSTVTFDGVDYLDVPSTIENYQTVFIVYNDTSTASYTAPIGTETVDGKESYHGNINNTKLFALANTDLFTLNGNNFKNGTEIDDQATGRPQTHAIMTYVASGTLVRDLKTIGRGGFSTTRVIDGDIAEIIILDNAVSTENRVEITFYLSQKWSMTSIVDSDEDGFVDSEDTTPTENTGDADGDGVPDAKDAFPTDSTKVLADANIPDALLAVSANIVVWLTDEVTVNAVATAAVGLESNGIDVNTWYDYSSNGNHVSQSTGSAQPTLNLNVINGRDVVRFDGTDDVLINSNSAGNLDLVTNQTVFIVFSPRFTTAVAGSPSPMGIRDNSNTRISVHETSDGTEFGTYDGSSFDSYTAPFVENDFFIYSGRWASNVEQLYINGELLGSSTHGWNNGTANLPFNVGDSGRTGFNEHWDGDIAELIILDTNVSNAELAAVNDYLAEKWELAVSDSDGDGVPDAKDEFPTDSTRVLPDSSIPSALIDVSANLTLWLTASDVTVNGGVTQPMTLSGAVVTNWFDLSGSGTIVTAINGPTYVSSGMNGLGSLDYDGSNDTFRAISFDISPSIKPTMSIYIVFDSDQAAGSPTRKLFGADNGSFDRSVGIDSRATLNFTYFDGTGVRDFTTIAANTNILVKVEYTGSGSQLLSGWVDGTKLLDGVALSHSSNLSDLSIGSINPDGEYWNGMINEFIVVEEVLSNAQDAEINYYLSQKWGLTATVDSDGDGAVDDDDAGPTDNTFVVTLPAMPAAIDAVSANVLVWVDSSVTSNLIITENRVKVFADLSGNGRNGVQGTDSKRPTIATGSINSLHALKFDGTDDIFHFSDENLAVQPLAIFVVIKKTSDQSGQRGIVSTDDGAIGGQSIGLNGNTLEIQTHNTDYSTSFSARQGAVTLISALYDGDATSGSGGSASGSRVDVYIDGIRILGQVYTSLILDNVDGLKIGGHEIGSSTYFDGEIGEVLILDFVPTDAQRIDIEEYLLDKWGVLKPDGLFFAP